MRKILLTSICLLMAFCVQLRAQERTITGTVTSSDDGTTLPGVSVVVKGTSRGANTDGQGKYSISVPANAQLVFSFVGFEKQEVAIGNRSTVNVTLQTDATQLNEVVVTGYGGVLNKRELTGAISQVKGSTIENMPIQSFDRALQGRAAGVQVSAANGVPGGAVQVRIRGVGSISAGNDPLYIVDGVQLNSNNNSSFTSSNPLNFLNPNDIESMEVLKDAAAASIYGSQAANGVIIITTKKGKAGKTKFDFDYYKGMVEPIQYLNVLNSQQWIQMRTEALFNQNSATNSAYTLQQARTAALTGIRQAGDLSEAQIAALPTYDWQRAAFKSGSINNYELKASGGNDKTTFYWSGSLNDQDANLINVDFQRATTSLKVDHKVNTKFSFSESLNFSTTKARGQFGGPGGGSFLGLSSFSSPLMLPTVPIYKEDGSYFGTPADGGTPGILNQNIIMVSELNKIQAVVNQVVGNLTANYKFTDNLTLRALAGIDYRTIKGDNFTDPRTPDAFNVNGRASFQYNQNVNFLTNATLNFNKTFADLHGVGALVGVEYRSDVNEGYSGTGEGFPTPDFIYLNSSTNYTSLGGFWTGFRKNAVFGQLKYDFANKYYFSAIGRYDGSSRFGKNNRFGFFPSVSAGWLLSEESFLKTSKVINQLKIRASYGSTGNDQIGNFPSLGTYVGGANYNAVSGIAATTLANADLRWERNVEFAAGLDYSILNNRVYGQIDYFDRTSKDLLLAQQVPSTSGFGAITSNVGEVKNKGWEFEINTVNVKTPKFKWETNFNFTVIDNYVSKLYDGIRPQANKDSLILITAAASGVNRTFILGKPVYANYTVEYAGVNPATGRAMFYDENGNIVYNFLNPRDLKYFGSELSKVFGGFTNTLGYGGLELSVFFQYDFGRKAFNNQGSFLSENGNRNFNTLTSVYERRWQKPGDITDVPRPYNGAAELRGASYMSGTRTLEDASYIRLKQVNLSYNLPQNLLLKTKFLRTARVYAQALNLLTWTKWTGYDPEFINFGAGNNGVVPQSRSYTFGVSLGF